MLYTFNIRALVRRYFPPKLRHEENIAWGYALLKPLEFIHNLFLTHRDTVNATYNYNGLKHSLEALLNDTYDPVLRRIYITVSPQVPVLHCLDEAEPARAWCQAEEELAGFWCTDEGEGALYLHEFSINVPVALPVNYDELFALVDIYRYAGRRPNILLRDNFLTIVGNILHPDVIPAL